MNHIAYVNTNEEIVLYIHEDSTIRMVDIWRNIEYYQNGDNLIEADSIAISFNDQYILYNYDYIGRLSDTDDLYDINQLNIMSFDRFRRGDFENIMFKFRTDGIIDDICVSKNRNHVAIVFNVIDIYSVFMNEEEARHPLSRDDTERKYFLHVYNFTEGNSRLIFNKQYDGSIHVTLSEIDTIAINYVNTHDNNKIFEIYDLNTSNNILSVNDQSIINFGVLCMQYLPPTEQFPNHLVLLTYDWDQALIQSQMRVINLEGLYQEILRHDYSHWYDVMDIARNGNIIVGGTNGLLFNNSVDTEFNRHLYDGLCIGSVSFSPRAYHIAVSVDTEIQGYDDVRPRASVYSLVYYTTIFGFQENSVHPLEDEDEEDEDEEDEEDEDEEDEEDEDEEEILINPKDLNSCVIPPSNPALIQLYGNKTCFDIIQQNEENIGNYLSADRDNIVIFYKQIADADFLATCLTFTGLKKYLQDPKHAFYRCIHRKDHRTYIDDQPDFLKIPTQTITIFVSYEDIKQKYIQRQNMIFLEYIERVDTTITYEAIITNNYISSNHCQDGSLINVYRIIF